MLLIMWQNLKSIPIDGEKKMVYVHRKGATRAFPPGHKDVAVQFTGTVGQPVLIPGAWVRRPLYCMVQIEQWNLLSEAHAMVQGGYQADLLH